jgi:universal stress protein E
MKTPESILVVMPPRQRQRQASPALHRAIAYAQRSGATLHLCLFDYYGPIDYSRTIFGMEVADRARHDFVEERMHGLSREAAALAERGLRVECEAVWAPHAHEAIVAKVLELKPDLVLKDVDCDGAGAGCLHPSALDWKLLRLCPAPLMLVRPQARLVPQRLMAAVDVTAPGGESLNQRVAAAAAAYAGLSGATWRIASVFSYVPVDTYGTGFIADTYEIMDNSHREALSAFSAAHQVPAQRVLRRSAFDTAEGLAACAEDCQADLVVLGSAYHSGLDRLMSGTTAEALLRRLHCDVLLIKPAGFELEAGRHVDLHHALYGRFAVEAPAAGVHA